MKAGAATTTTAIQIYQSFMRGTIDNLNIRAKEIFQRLTPKVLKRHRIVKLPERRRTLVKVYLLNIKHDGSVAEYKVRFGEFHIYLKILNLRVKASKIKDSLSLGGGGFGDIMLKTRASKDFAIKLQKTLHQHHVSPITDLINKMIIEVAIGKLCSALGIGPALETTIPFDLIVYEDGVQFHLERCQSKKDWQRYQEKLHNQFERDVKTCLLMLHRIGIAHKDIKPDNILWSNRDSRFVLCDFGVSEYTMQSIGGKTKTCYGGTKGFMCAEMERLQHKDTKGFVDLIYNDIYSLGKSIDIIFGQKNLQFPSGPWISDTVSSILLTNTEVISNQLASYSQESEQQMKFEFSEKQESQQIINISQSSQNLSEDSVVPNDIKYVDSYEFYTFFNAVISLHEHQFDVLENFPYLSEWQLNFLYNILSNCRSKEKIQILRREFQKADKVITNLNFLNGKNFRQKPYTLKILHKFISLLDKIHRNFILQPRLERNQTSKQLSCDMIYNYMRLLGKNKILKELIQDVREGELTQRVRKQKRKIRAVMSRAFFLPKRFKMNLDMLFTCWQLKYQTKYVLEYIFDTELLSRQFKQDILNDLLSVVQKPSPKDENYLQMLIHILEKTKRTEQLLDFIKQYNESKNVIDTDRCVWLVFVHSWINDDQESSDMLECCQTIIEMLNKYDDDNYRLQKVLFIKIAIPIKLSQGFISAYQALKQYQDCLRILESSCADDHPQLKVLLLVDKSVNTFMFGVDSNEHLQTLRQLKEQSNFYQLTERQVNQMGLLYNCFIKTLKFQPKRLLTLCQNLPWLDGIAVQMVKSFLKPLCSEQSILDLGAINKILCRMIDSLQQLFKVMILIQPIQRKLFNQLPKLMRDRLECEILKRSGEYEECLQKIKHIETNSNLQKIPGIKSIKQSLLEAKAYCKEKLGNIENLPAIIKQQIKNSSQISENCAELAELYVKLARVYASLQNRKSALNYMYKAEKLFNTMPGVSCKIRAYLCYQIGCYLYNSRDQHKSMYYFDIALKLAQNGSMKQLKARDIFRNLRCIDSQRRQLERQICLYWHRLENTEKLKICNIAQISKALFGESIPIVKLLFGLETDQYICEAEARTAHLTYKQQLKLYLFQKRLLSVLNKKINGESQLGPLFYIRIAVDIHMHMLMADDYKGVIRQLPSVIQFLQGYTVCDREYCQKENLIAYAENMLQRAKNAVIQSQAD